MLLNTSRDCARKWVTMETSKIDHPVNESRRSAAQCSAMDLVAACRLFSPPTPPLHYHSVLNVVFPFHVRLAHSPCCHQNCIEAFCWRERQNRCTACSVRTCYYTAGKVVAEGATRYDWTTNGKGELVEGRKRNGGGGAG